MSMNSKFYKMATADVSTGPLFEDDDDVSTEAIPDTAFKPGERKHILIWPNIISTVVLQLVAFYAIYAAITSAQWATCFWAYLLYHCGYLGIAAGYHRLWSHRAFKAKWPLKVILAYFGWMAHQKSILVWSRDHRMHHKFQDTDADPINPKRGFFFAHCGWIMVKKHPDVLSKGSRLDVSDLSSDPIVSFQHKYYYALMPLFTYVLPTVVPMYFWNETFVNAFSLNVFRYMSTLHSTWIVNSIAHRWGMKPFDKFVGSTENLFINLWTAGEGWHNFHHTFPWDYKSSEVGRLNIPKHFIEFCAKIGWAYDLKSPSEDMIRKRVQRTGDGSHKHFEVERSKTG